MNSAFRPEERASIPTEGLSDLIATLEKAEAGSRELDAAIARLLSGGTEHWFSFFGTWSTDNTIPALTTSLDATLALAERLGWSFWSGGQGTENAWAHLYDRHPDQDGPTHNAKAKTPALALCIAVLKAVANSPSPDSVGTSNASEQNLLTGETVK